MNAAPASARLKKLLTIHLVMQLIFILLFVYMAFHFQQAFAQKGESRIFFNSLIVTFVLQLGLLYPIYKFAAFEAKREIATYSTNDPEVLKQLRQKRIYGDVIKSGVFVAYTIFIAIAPPATAVLSIAFFSFMATIISYLQCFNYTAKRLS